MRKGASYLRVTGHSQTGREFYDTRATEEAVDKLVHHSIIITIKGPSYRLKEKLDQMGPLA